MSKSKDTNLPPSESVISGLGSFGHVWAEKGRKRQIWAEMGRYEQFWTETGRFEHLSPTRTHSSKRVTYLD